jgi:hypothetical protein
VKPLISFFSFYIKSSIHVALGVTGLVFVTSIEFGVTLPIAFYWVSFLGTITGYNFIKYAEIAGLQHKSLIRSLQNLQMFSLVVFCLLVYFLTQLHLVVLTYLCVLGFLTLLYVIPTINHKNFRSLAGVKVFIVALVWSGLHGMLANTKYKGLSGTNVSWDFVELPSQILENWCYEKQTLELFATHYKTGEVIPMELIEKIKASATFHEGMQTLRQLSFGMLDMAWHGSDPSKITSVKDFENSAFGDTVLYPDTPNTCMSTAFSHIFQGGYSAGYYSYKWAEVLDADAFAYFKKEGIFNKKVARKFKDFILSKGGTQDPMELYIKFRGQKPNPDALLERAGLV